MSDATPLSRKYNRFTVEEADEMIRRYTHGESAASLARERGCYTSVVSALLQRRGVERRTMRETKQQHAIDESVFDQITEESAYWIGFLMADGCVSYRSNKTAEVILVAGEKDAVHIEAFRSFLKASHPIAIVPPKKHFAVKHRNVHRFSVNSIRLADALGRYGVTPRKSFTAQVSPSLAYNRNFWRGAVDGDGWVGFRNAYPAIGLCGSKYLVGQFYLAATRLIPELDARVRPKQNITSLAVTGYQAAQMCYWLYGGCGIALPRKLDTATEAIAFLQAAGEAKARRKRFNASDWYIKESNQE